MIVGITTWVLRRRQNGVVPPVAERVRGPS
jgi:hypothetical protein